MTDYTSLSAGTYLPLAGYLNLDGSAIVTAQNFLVSPSGDYELGLFGTDYLPNPYVDAIVVGYGSPANGGTFTQAYVLATNTFNNTGGHSGGSYLTVATIGGQQYLADYWSQTAQPGGPGQQLISDIPTTSKPQTSPSSVVQLGDNGAVSFVTGSSTVNATPKWNVTATSFTIQSINYDFSDITTGTPSSVSGDGLTVTNSTNKTQHSSLQLQLGYTKSTSFAFTLGESVTLSVGSTDEVDIPGIGKSSVTWGLSETTNVSDTFTSSTSQQVTYGATSNLTVPPGETYSTQIVGTQESASIPYTAYGMFTYSNGVTAEGTTTGVFTGVDIGDFQVLDSCVAGCPSGSLGQTLPAANGHYTLPPGYLPVAAPPMALPLLAVGWGTLALLRRRRIQRRAPSVPAG